MKSASCKRMGSKSRIGGTRKISSPMLAGKRGDEKSSSRSSIHA